MIRFVLSCTAAAMLLAAPVAANAATKKAMHSHKPAKHMASKRSGQASASRASASRPAQGSAAVDALNEQSLTRARAGQ